MLESRVGTDMSWYVGCWRNPGEFVYIDLWVLDGDVDIE